MSERSKSQTTWCHTALKYESNEKTQETVEEINPSYGHRRRWLDRSKQKRLRRLGLMLMEPICLDEHRVCVGGGSRSKHPPSGAAALLHSRQLYAHCFPGVTSSRNGVIYSLLRASSPRPLSSLSTPVSNFSHCSGRLEQAGTYYI